MKKNNFIKCGLFGLCLEVLWTGSINCIHHDPKMSASTSLLMFPIYGLAAFIKPISSFLKGSSFIVRGTIYTIGIYFVEYTSGTLLKAFGICPWNYENAKYNLNGLIRLDYAPAWFTAGLLFEKLLNSTEGGSHTAKK